MAEHIAQVDADRLKIVEHHLRLRTGSGECVTGDHAMVCNRVEGLLRHGVDRIRTDQFSDVERVGVVRILNPGGRPQRALNPAAGLGKRRPAPTRAEHLFVGGVGEPGIGHAGQPAQCERRVGADCLQSLVDFGVDSGDEERRNGMDGVQVVAGLLCGFQAGQVGVHHRAVPLDGEDQGHVYRNALGQNGGDGRQTGQCRGNLDQRVGPVNDFPQFDGLQDRLVGVVGQPRIDLDGDPTVDPVGGPVLRPQHIAGLPHVIGGRGSDGGVDIGTAGSQFADLSGVCGARGQRSLENRGVGGDAHHALGVDEFGKVSRPQSVAGQVVEPDGNARLGQLRQVSVLLHVISP